jgi:DNA-binding XRE family transcriptional regulator
MDAEVCARRLPRIIEFIGYEPDTDRYDVAAVIERFRRETGISYEKLAKKVGVCADTLVNLKNGRYRPTRRTYDRIVAFAETVTS